MAKPGSPAPEQAAKARPASLSCGCCAFKRLLCSRKRRPVLFPPPWAAGLVDSQGQAAGQPVSSSKTFALLLSLAASRHSRQAAPHQLFCSQPPSTSEELLGSCLPKRGKGWSAEEEAGDAGPGLSLCPRVHHLDQLALVGGQAQNPRIVELEETPQMSSNPTPGNGGTAAQGFLTEGQPSSALKDCSCRLFRDTPVFSR